MRVNTSSKMRENKNEGKCFFIKTPNAVNRKSGTKGNHAPTLIKQN